VADIALTRGERICLQCGGTLEEIQAVEVGHIFKLGDYYTRTMDLAFQDEHGRAAYPHMGCWGIGLGRLMDAVAWANRDERGLAWPEAVAPFRAFLMSIGQSLAVKKAVEELAADLGEEALFDDREDSPGVKFKDADLLGIPLRLVVSTKHWSEGLVEVQERRTGRVRLLTPAQAARAVQDLTGAGTRS
jgi:prolyl-tRNA synthetase